MNSLYNTEISYGSITKFFHWVIAFLVIIMLFAFFLEDIPNKILRGVAFNAHKLLGLSILALMVLRFLWILYTGKPALPNSPPWERLLERMVHWTFYLLLFLMPLAGWIGTSAGGHPPRLGTQALGLPLGKNEALSDLAFNVHNTLAIVLLVLISLHILAAFFHYFVRRDSVLQRMLP